MDETNTALLSGLSFSSIWAIDFEFNGDVGERPSPVCMVARELLSGTEFHLWRDELSRLNDPPFPIDETSAVVAYFSSAEIGCFLALGWAIPVNIIDLYAEFRVRTNGLKLPLNRSLLGALNYYGVEAISVGEKNEMRDLILRQNEWGRGERSAILQYCAEDVVALERLFPEMMPDLNLPHALLRGRYMAAVARIEWGGIPVDSSTYQRICENWDLIKLALIQDVDQAFGIYEGTTFKTGRFSEYLERSAMRWPRGNRGIPKLDAETFKERTNAYPQLRPLKELRVTLSELRLNDLAIGSDSRNRTLISPFASKTGRKQPSNSRFIFGPSKWIRSLIKPEVDHGLAYIDYASQEIGIAAALSRDNALISAYLSGDPYLAFAKQIGLVPQDATRTTHKEARDRCKAVVLGVNYGMGPNTLAHSVGISVCEARELLQLHKRAYSRFWEWSDAAVDSAMLGGRITAAFGWALRVGQDPNPRSLRNFPMQANGAEMLRLACIAGTEAEIPICAPIHDALLIHAPLSRLDANIEHMREIMAEASRAVLGGFEIRTDVHTIRWPERYRDEKGQALWRTVLRVMDGLEASATCPPQTSFLWNHTLQDRTDRAKYDHTD